MSMSDRAIAQKNPQLLKLEVPPGKPLTVSSILLKQFLFRSYRQLLTLRF